jgi:predicted  nucleic acid-binding Zn-ribbon protein
MEMQIVVHFYYGKEVFSMTDQNNNQNLRELLEKLHNELEHIEAVDESGNEMLRHLDTDIRTLLKRSRTKVETDEPMLERLQDTIDYFESRYPRLTMMLSEMMTILSNAGV